MPDNELQIGARFDTAPITAGMDEATAVTEEATSSMSGFFATLGQAVTGFGATVKSAMMGAATDTTEATDTMKERFVETAEAAKLSGAGIGAAFSGIGALLGAGLFVSFAAEAVDSVVEINVELGHLAEKTGISVTALAGLQQITKQMGMDFQSVGTGLQFLLYNQSLAVTGSQKQIDAFKDLGITMSDLKTLSPEDIFRKTAEAIGSETDKSAQLYHARTLLGRGGAALIPLFDKYKGSLDAAAESEGKLTGITEDSVAASERWTASMAKLTEFMHSLCIPVIEHFGDVLLGIKGVFDIVILACDSIAIAIASILKPLGSVAKALYDLVAGNYDKLLGDTKSVASDFTGVWKEGIDDIHKRWKQVKDDFTAEPDAPKHETTPTSPGTDVGGKPGKVGGAGHGGNPDATYGAENKAAEDALKQQEANIQQSIALAVQGGEEKAQAELDAIPKLIAAQQAYTQAKEQALDKEHDLQLKANADQRKAIEAGNSADKTAELAANAKAKLDIEAKYQADKKNIATEGETAITALTTQGINARTQLLQKAAQESLAVLEASTAQKQALAKQAADESVKEIEKNGQLALQKIQQQEEQGLITRKEALAEKKTILQQEAAAATAAYDAEKDKLTDLISAYQAQQSTLSTVSPEYKKLTDDINHLKLAYSEVQSAENKFSTQVTANTTKITSDVKLQSTTWTQFFQKYKVETQQAADTFRTSFQNSINQLNSGIGNAFSQWAIQGKSFGQSMMQVGGQILSSFVSMLVQMGLKWIETHVMMAIFGKTSQTTAALSDITSNAAVGAAAASAATAAIPIVGPALAPAAGAAMFSDIMTWGALASAAGGWDMVPQDQLAQVHKNEMILPANIASPMRSMLKGGQLGGGQGDMHLHSNINIHAMDSKSMAQAIQQHGDVIGNIAVGKMQKAYKQGKFR